MKHFKTALEKAAGTKFKDKDLKFPIEAIEYPSSSSEEEANRFELAERKLMKNSV